MLIKKKSKTTFEISDFELFLKLRYFIRSMKSSPGEKLTDCEHVIDNQDEINECLTGLFKLISMSTLGLDFVIDKVRLKAISAWRVVVAFSNQDEVTEVTVEPRLMVGDVQYCGGCQSVVYWHHGKKQWVDGDKYVTQPDVSQYCWIDEQAGSQLHKTVER